MVMMFVGGVVLMLDRILVLFLLKNSYGAGVFSSRPNSDRGKAVNNISTVFEVCDVGRGNLAISVGGIKKYFFCNLHICR